MIHSRPLAPRSAHLFSIRRKVCTLPVYSVLVTFLCAIGLASTGLASTGLASTGVAAPNTAVTISDPSTTNAPSTAIPIEPYDGPALNVVVSLPPLRGLIEPLLPRGSRVGVLVPVGASEHAFEIPPSRLAEMSKADVVVTVGMGLEPQVDKWLDARPNAGRVHVRFEDLASITPPADEAGHADHADHADHSGHAHDEHGNCIHHHGVDPHLWLDPILCKSLVDEAARQVDRLLSERSDANQPGKSDAQARAEALATSRAGLERARLALHARLDALDAAFKQLAEDAKNADRSFVVGHDAYGRWTERYGLKTIPLAGMHATEPSPAAIQKAITTIRAMNEGSKGAASVYVEPQLSRGSADRIAKSTGATIRVLDPLGDGDYFKTAHGNIDALRAGIATGSTKSP